MRRRDFITLLAARRAWPLAARAQQPTMPVIGFLNSLGQNDRPNLPAAFRRGLSEAGYVDGRNVAIEYRFAENQHDRLPTLAADLVGRKVAVIAATGGGASILAAKAGDHNHSDRVHDWRRPGPGGLRRQPQPAGRQRHGSELVRYLARRQGAGPAARTRSQCCCARRCWRTRNFRNPRARKATRRRPRARSAGSCLFSMPAPRARSTPPSPPCGNGAPARFLSEADPFFTSRRQQIVALAARDAIPAMYSNREFVEEGGLMSYGNDTADAYRRAGVYVGRILKGATPADLPVDQATKFEFVINLKTAKALGLDVPPGLSARADEVIE